MPTHTQSDKYKLTENQYNLLWFYSLGFIQLILFTCNGKHITQNR